MSSKPSRYLRFDRWERIEHGVLIFSFTVLTITGLPQKWPDSVWGNALIQLMGGIEWTRILHHTAAVILIISALYHLLAVTYRIFVLKWPLTMLPTWTDAKNGAQALAYNLGRALQPPKMGRYTFGEKLEYWAVIWGTMIMILTGFVLWNPIVIARFFPGQFIPAAKAAHGGEALLAVLSIVTWHLFNVHVKHFNKSMFTGYLDRHTMEEEHALELEAIESGQPTAKPSDAGLRRRRLIYWPIAIVVSVGMALGVYLFLTVETTAITTVPRQEIEVFVPVTPTVEP